MMKCQHHDFYIGRVAWPALVSSAEFMRIVDTARLRVDGVLMLAADAPLRSSSSRSSSSKHPTLQCATMELGERGDDGQGDDLRDDIPAQVGEFLVDSLQRHFVWVVEVVVDVEAGVLGVVGLGG